MKQRQHIRKYKKSKKFKIINRGFKKWQKPKFKWIENRKEKEKEESDSIINDIKTFEKSLPSKKNHEFIWLPGKNSVIISAPHAVKHFRRVLVTKDNVETVKSYTKKPDDYTGGIAYALNKRTGMKTIILTRPGTYDPNIYDGVPYKMSISNNKSGTVLLLDLHGAMISRDFNVALGTIGGKSLLDHPGYLDSLLNHLRQQGIKNVKVNPTGFDAGGENSQHTVTYYTSHMLEIPAIQIEINEKYRNPDKYPDNVIKLVNALENFIKE